MIASPVMTPSIDGSDTTVLSRTIATRRAVLSAEPSPKTSRVRFVHLSWFLKDRLVIQPPCCGPLVNPASLTSSPTTLATSSLNLVQALLPVPHATTGWPGGEMAPGCRALSCLQVISGTLYC